MSTFRTKRNDTRAHEEYLQRETGLGTDVWAAIDLTGATVRWLLSRQDGSLVVAADASIVDATTGRVKYDFASGGTEEAGVFRQEWEVTYSTGVRETIPTGEKYNTVIVGADIG